MTSYHIIVRDYGKLLATTYAEELFQKLSVIPKNKLHAGILDAANFGPDWKPKPALSVGTHTFYLPLPVSWIDQSDIDRDLMYLPVFLSGKGASTTHRAGRKSREQS